jgi:hypothetical protein
LKEQVEAPDSANPGKEEGFTSLFLCSLFAAFREWGFHNGGKGSSAVVAALSSSFVIFLCECWSMREHPEMPQSPLSRNARQLSRRLFQVKSDLQLGDTSSLLSLVEDAEDRETLSAIREQKLLLRIPSSEVRQRLADKYKESAKRILCDSPEFLHEANYAQFVVLISDQRDLLAKRVAESLKCFPRVSPIELVRAANALMLAWFEKIWNTMWEQVSPELKLKKNAGDLSSTAAGSERTLHEINGMTNDVAFAVARAINEAFKVVDRHKAYASGRAVTEGTSKALLELIEFAFMWNSFEYAADQLSYGEWVVRSIQYSGPTEVVLDIRDPILTYARMIGLRREVVSLKFGKERPSAARLQLERLVPDFLDNCMEYLTIGASLRCGPVEMSSLKSKMQRGIAELDPNDDLLLVAAGPDFPVIEDYIAALSLRWFCDIAEFAANHLPRRMMRELNPPVSTIEAIGAMLPLEESQRLRVMVTLDELIQDPPVTRHLALIASPFIRLPHSQIVCFPTLNCARWPADIRAKWLRKGNVGRRFGNLWEAYAANMLENFGWKILGKGTKLRKNGQVVTDVDLLAFRDGLLLILQIKALAGQGTNPYDHWKNRKIIEEGARQAAAAAACLKTEMHLLWSICPKRAVPDVRLVQSAVLTNLHQFNGWNVGDIPVISRNGLLTILNGAVVTRQLPDQTILETEHFSSQKTWDENEFVRLMKNPVDWQVAQESLEVTHNCKELEGVRYHIPNIGQWQLNGDIPHVESHDND